MFINDVDVVLYLVVTWFEFPPVGGVWHPDMTSLADVLLYEDVTTSEGQCDVTMLVVGLTASLCLHLC